MPTVKRLASLFAFASLTVSIAAREFSPWDKIKPHFAPPREFTDKTGDYRSPLLFEDGTPVKTPQDWQRRRAELLKKWNDLLGHPPSLLEKPKLEISESAQRENFTQHKIHVEVAAGHLTPGYLLVPGGNG